MVMFRVRVDKGLLLKPLHRAQGIVARTRASAGISSAIHIVASEDQRLVFTATDYDVTLATAVSATVEEPGAILVGGRAIFDVIRALPDGAEILLVADDRQRVRIECGRSRCHLNSMGPEEFPDVLEESTGRCFEMDKSIVEGMFRRTLFSASTDESRVALNGVLLELEPVGCDADLVRVRMVSSDGHRLSKVERTVAIPGYGGGVHRTIVHRRGAAELSRIFESSDATVRIELLARNIVFESDHTRLQVRQIDESFPDYQRVIPDGGKVNVAVSRAALNAAIRRVSTLGGGKHARLKVELARGVMALEMEDAVLGDAHDEIEVDYAGESVAVGFNPRYILDVLNVVEGERVRLSLSDPFLPCLLQSDEEPGAVFV